MTEVRSWGAQQGYLSGMLEPYDGKLSRTVLRGTGGRKAPWSTRYPPRGTEKRLRGTLVAVTYERGRIRVGLREGCRQPR